ncbi:acyl-CoA thioesterase [Photobacterium lutimaris]|uniref:Acyl-CoA thioesterase n=1 Tax=Photobacterium lutimaris TaxID=388278 RepID=A0A2T3J556_9GAMM|nr:acyl-CoA thioesterase [Photobacterium lutimaris]PSU36419.1 acyl-CoA thioesterase [Photobacterium lutimaris]TDR74679.1 acyl-CoA thioester hydrolase [Photobacterium lutimaris]
MSNLLEGYPVVTEIPVAWGEMDALNHVNNVVYFRYFETARLEYFADIGLMEEMQATQTGPVLSETSSRYRRPVTYPDTLLVGSRVAELTKDSFVMEYKIVSKQQGAVTTSGSAKVVMFNFAQQKRANLSPTLIEKMISMQPDLDAVATD